MDWATFFKEYQGIISWDLFEMNTSMVILGDRKIAKLNDELRSLIFSEEDHFATILKRINAENGDDLFNDAKVQLDKVREYSVKAHFLITDIKLRLDELAQKT